MNPHHDLPLPDLSPAEEAAIDRILFGEHEDAANPANDADSLAASANADLAWELLAAVPLLASIDESSEAMPAALRAKIARSAGAYVSPSATSRDANPRAATNAAANLPPVGFDGKTPTASTDSVSLPPRLAPSPAVLYLGMGAVAASLLVATVLSLNSILSPATSSTLTVAQQRQILLNKALQTQSAELVRTTWTNPAEPNLPNELGDVVWDNGRQQGFMRFTSSALKANDRNAEQYQLWIFDDTQDERYPIDGGVFDVVSSDKGEVIVPIQAKIAVKHPTAFAITIEKPGGVVVSDRSRLPLLAKVD